MLFSIISSVLIAMEPFQPVQHEEVTPEHDSLSVVDKETVVDEEVEWVVEEEEDDDDRVSLGIVGKVWTERHVNSNSRIATMRRIWNPRHGIEANNIGKNVFFFQFYHWRD